VRQIKIKTGVVKRYNDTENIPIPKGKKDTKEGSAQSRVETHHSKH
jgi:hypothetical protein